MPDLDVAIIGGGLSGLACARHLIEAGIATRVFEASEGVGGRAATDEHEGFLLDRGFQVLLTAYPEAKRVLDYNDLSLATFEPGALIRIGGKFHRFVDPWRRPRHALATAVSPAGTLRDKLRVARLRRRVCRGSLDDLQKLDETTTIAMLEKEGFSTRIVERFFRPFLGGVFLDHKLQTSSRMFDFVFRMFAKGDAALPANGMRAMAQQMADRLPDDSTQLGATVERVTSASITLTSGESITARAVVVACEAPMAAKLFGEVREANGQAVTCLYFAADRPPIVEPILVLNGDGRGPINNLCVPSQVSPSYAPVGQSLISVTVLGVHDDNDKLRASVMDQLQDWFGEDARSWRHLRTYSIPFALPRMSPPSLTPVAKPARRDDGIFVCGDHCDTASINGALLSGRRAAECVLESLE